MYRLHWYAHTEGCCTDGAGRNVQVTLVRTHRGSCTNGAGGSVQVTLVRTHRGTLYKWSSQKCTGYIGTLTQRDAVQMEQAEMYRIHRYTHTQRVLYKWSRRKCTGYIVTHTQRDAVQMEQAEVYMLHWYAHREVLYKWSRRKCIGTGSVHGYGKRRTEKERTRRTVKSRASPRDCFLFFRLDKVRVPYKSGSTSCEKCPLTCKDGLCGKILMLCL